MAQLDYALIDVDFFDKPKVKGLIFRFGNDGALFLLRSILLLSRSTNAECSIDALYGLGYEMRIEVDEVDKILAYCETHGMLARLGDIFQNSRVLVDHKKLESKREQTKARVERYREKSNADVTRYKSVTDEECNALQTRFPDTVTVTVTNIDLNKENSRPHSDVVEIPEVPQEAAQAIHRWCEHRKKIGKELDQQAVDSLVMLYQHKIDELAEDIDHTIANGWKSLQQKQRQQARAGPKEKSTKDFIRDEMARIQAEKNDTGTSFESDGDFGIGVRGSVQDRSRPAVGLAKSS